MTTLFDWRHAFLCVEGTLTPQQFERVKDKMYDWDSSWSIEYDSRKIYRVEDSDGDGIWDQDYDDPEYVDTFFSSEFVDWMDNECLGKPKPKKPIFVGQSTKLPFPGSRP